MRPILTREAPSVGNREVALRSLRFEVKFVIDVSNLDRILMCQCDLLSQRLVSFGDSLKKIERLITTARPNAVSAPLAAHRQMPHSATFDLRASRCGPTPHLQQHS